MSNMSKQEIIDEMIAEGYDYDTAYRLVFGDITNKDFDCEQAFNEFFGTNNDGIDDSDSELDLLARADEVAAYNEDYERYMSAMRHDFPRDFADDDPFTSALLDWCENTEEE